MASTTTRSDDDVTCCLSDTKLKWYREEKAALHDAFRNEPSLIKIPPTRLPSEKSDSASTHLDRKTVGRYVEGQRLPLTKLTQVLAIALCEENQSEVVDLKVVICDVATRKFYGPKEGKEDVDLAPFEDVSRGPFWFWELRSLALLPEELKLKASLARQKRKQMQDRLMALSAVIRLSEKENMSKWTAAMQKRVQKAIEKLEHVPDLQTINEKFSENEERKSLQRGGKRLKREDKVDSESSATKEMKRQEKMATVSGFGSVKSLKNAQSMFKRFFDTPQKNGPGKGNSGQGFNIAGQALLSCPENKTVTFSIGIPELLDDQLHEPTDPDRIRSEFLQFCQGNGILRNPQKSVIYGAPATWARRPEYRMRFEEECERLFGCEWKSMEIRAVRMKYLWFNSDSDCPPYFGPVSKIDGVTARNPFIKSPVLDYDEIFDEGWEEGPEGESLSVEDEDEEDKYPMSDEDEAFIVEDGYLSEDEGIGADMEIDEECSNSSSVETDAELQTMNEGTTVRTTVLEVWLKSSIRTGHPVICTTLPIASPSHKDWTRGNPAMLDSVEAIRHGPEKVTLNMKKDKT